MTRGSPSDRISTIASAGPVTGDDGPLDAAPRVRRLIGRASTVRADVPGSDHYAPAAPGHWPEPMRAARITACVRLSTSSLVRIAETCALTVASETPSS
jgi:hypothetical protein